MSVMDVSQAGEEELEVVFLGTGAAMPSKYRNVTSIYINRFARGGMLLDCGEGTLGQLTRRFGRNTVKHVVCGLACVWVSHIHADHHAGLPRSALSRHWTDQTNTRMTGLKQTPYVYNDLGRCANLASGLLRLDLHALLFAAFSLSHAAQPL